MAYRGLPRAILPWAISQKYTRDTFRYTIQGGNLNIKSVAWGIPESTTLKEVIRKKGALVTITTLVAVLIAFFHLYTSVTGVFEALQHRSLHLYAILVFIFLYSSIKKRGSWYLALNIVLALLSGVIGVYFFIEAPAIHMRSPFPLLSDTILAIITILLVLEATRRVAGLALSIMAGLFVIYPLFTPYLPGILRAPRFSISEIINVQFMVTDGLWGIPLGVMSTFIIIFLLLAGLLAKSGMIDAFIALANKLLGQTTGGPAKMAVLASTGVGMISGSAAANVLITGQISIPAMKKLGYTPTFAGAVEAGASTGGQFTPPIMGASAFIIAAFLGIPYIQVAIAAVIPALLWFLTYFCAVHLEAKKLKLKTMSREEVAAISWVFILKRMYIFIPLILLVYLLVIGYSPMYAGFICVLVSFALSFLSKETRLNLGSLAGAFRDGIEGALPVTMACASAGLIVGGVMLSGLGYTLSLSLVVLSGGYLLPLLLLAMVAAIILGFGMTTVGVYIIVAIMVVPALIELGVVPLAAHFFPFWFGIISAITPPVAVASFAAAGISGASPWSIGWMAMKLGIPLFVIPFVFVTQPGLILVGPWSSILITVTTTTVAVMLLVTSTVGYLLRRLKKFERVLFFGAGIALLFPDWWVNLIALAIAGVSILLQRVTK
jgi:TRAP transporter 4TM/12TM fusion protein